MEMPSRYSRTSLAVLTHLEVFERLHQPYPNTPPLTTTMLYKLDQSAFDRFPKIKEYCLPIFSSLGLVLYLSCIPFI
jgi:hypothetical protein